MTGSLLPASPELADRLSGAPLLVMLDIDGTLAPIAPRPDDAIVPMETRRIIAALAARPSVHVVLVSGRAAADARRMVGVANVWVVGNHGIEVVSPDGDETIDPRIDATQHAVAQAAAQIRGRIADVPGVILEDKRWTLSLHYRLADPAVVPRLRALASELAIKLGLRLVEGKMVFELRPNVRVDKGSAVLALAERLDGLDADASILFAGDDTTDEDAFLALRSRSPRPVTIRVGEPHSTAAEFVAPDTDVVREFLAWLLESRTAAAGETKKGAP